MKLIFHIGFHKTGSSWLQSKYFSNHPQIILLNNFRQPWDTPLLHYLITTPDSRFDPIVCRDLLQPLLANARKAGGEDIFMVSAERLSGHPISGGGDNIQIALKIKRAFPDAGILMVIRNQKDIIASVYKQLVAEGCAASLDSLVKSKSWKTTYFNLAYWDYEQIIDCYVNIFGSDMVKVLMYEDMRNDREKFLRELCRMIDVPYWSSRDNNTVVNPSLPNCSIGLLRFINHFRQTELNRNPLLGCNIIHRTLYITANMAFKLIRFDKSILTEEIESLISDYYAHSNAKLEKRLSVNLKERSYPVA